MANYSLGKELLRMRMFLMAWLCLIISGCMMGPDFKAPMPPSAISYSYSTQQSHTIPIPQAGLAGQSQSFEPNADIPHDWWKLYHSSVLNELIEIGLTNNPSLEAAIATLKQAGEAYNAQIGGTLYPALNLQAGTTRQRTLPLMLGPAASARQFTVYNTSVNVSYVFDFFGATRRGLEGLRSTIEYQQYQVESANLSLAANIATTAIMLAAWEEQLSITQELIKLQNNELTLIKKQQQLGGVSGLEVLDKESQLAALQATLPSIQQNYTKSQHLLAVLLGKLPNELTIPTIKLDTLSLPSHIPVSLPSRLLQQRPDIRAAEALLHQACANVGVATANLLPQISLNGSYGWQSMSPNQLFKSSTGVWSLGGSLLQPILQGGALQAKRNEAIAAYDQANAQYKQTVLQAFQNVTDSLHALQNDAVLLQANQQLESAAAARFKIVSLQFKLGSCSQLEVLSARKQYLQARINTIQAKAARYTDTAALFQALGGGWWNDKAI